MKRILALLVVVSAIAVTGCQKDPDASAASATDVAKDLNEKQKGLPPIPPAAQAVLDKGMGAKPGGAKKGP